MADTSELFVRSVKLFKLAGKDASVPSQTSPTPKQTASRKTIARGELTTNSEPSKEFQPIVQSLMRTLLEDHPTLLNSEERQNLMDKNYCRNSLGLQLGGYALLRLQEDGRLVNGRYRYYADVYAGCYYVTNHWAKQYHRNNAIGLLRLVEKLVAELRDNSEKSGLEKHRAALQEFLE